MAVDAKKLFEKALQVNPRGRVNLYIDLNVYREFRRVCASRDRRVSRILEELLREFIESAEESFRASQRPASKGRQKKTP